MVIFLSILFIFRRSIISDPSTLVTHRVYDWLCYYYLSIINVRYVMTDLLLMYDIWSITHVWWLIYYTCMMTDILPVDETILLFGELPPEPPGVRLPILRTTQLSGIYFLFCFRFFIINIIPHTLTYKQPHIKLG
jgi:hypothetical protein